MIAAVGLLKNWKLIGLAALILGLVLSLWAGYAHYQGLVGKVDQLTIENEKVRMQAEMQAIYITQQTIALHEWKRSHDDLVKTVHELSQVATAARKETGRLHDLFAKHNFTELAIKKPGLIQNRVNAGTVNIFRMLECETGRDTSCGTDRKADKAGSPKP